MDVISWILGFTLGLGTFLPLVIQRKFREWTETVDRFGFPTGKGKLYKTLSDVALELHDLSTKSYTSLERSAERYRRTAVLWNAYFKFPLSSAIQSLKVFSEYLEPQVQSSRPNSPSSSLALETLVGYTKQISRGYSRSIRDLSTNIKLLGDFPAARGVISSIWLAELGNSSHVAVKILIPQKASTRQDEFIHEARIWFRASRHENILPLLGIARIRGSLALVSPWMPERDLRTYLKIHPDANRLLLLADIARGLAYLHSQGIVYGNLRLSTVVVSRDGRAYLSSFLFASSREDGFSPEMDNFSIVSPEFLRTPFDIEEQIISTAESDVFMYGYLAIEAFTDNMRHGLAFLRRILRGNPPERPHALENLGLTDEFWLLISKCCLSNAAQRPTMVEVACKIVRRAEAFAPMAPNALQRKGPHKRLQDISPEIKKISEYPIAGGGFCDLYLGERLGVEKVALKLVRFFSSTTQDKDVARRRFISEARLWAEFQHPRILELYGICDYGTMSLYMVSPWLKNGNILAYLSNVNPKSDRQRLLWEIAEGITYLHLHEPPVVHGDLKAANILITGAGTAVLADFGLSKFSSEATTTILQGVGSPRWMAPEVLLAGEDTTGPLKTQKSDIYAYGHVILEVLSGKKPFFNLKEDLHVIVEVMNKRRSPRPDGPVAQKWLDDTSWAISRQCTAPNPEERPGIDAILAELKRIHFDRVSRWSAAARGLPLT